MSSRRSIAPYLLALFAPLAAACSGEAQIQPVAPPPTAPPPTQQPAASAPPPAPLAPSPTPATFDVAGLSDRVKPTVVNITTTERLVMPDLEGIDPFEFFFGGPGPRNGQKRQRHGAGTGFIIDPNGYVITNEHVVADADDVRIKLADEREFRADVVGRDPKLDLALLKITGAKDLPAVALGSSDNLRVGEHVLAVGNPFGLGHTVTLGIVSAKDRSIGAGPYDDFIQTDASINPGNSGGPLFNWKGEVIGINTAIRQGANGIGFAIPVDALKEVLPQLRDKGFVERGRLGVGFQNVTPDLAKFFGLESPRGALITEIEPNGPASRAGMKSGDVVVAVNGSSVRNAEELPRRIARNAPGTTILVSFIRDKKQKEVSATLEAMRDDPTASPRRRNKPPKAPPSNDAQRGKVGIQVSDAPGGGVRVDDVTDADVRDLAVGDIIVEIDKKPIRDTLDLQKVMTGLKSGTTVLFRVRRGRALQYAAVPIPKR